LSSSTTKVMMMTMKMMHPDAIPANKATSEPRRLFPECPALLPSVLEPAQEQEEPVTRVLGVPCFLQKPRNVIIKHVQRSTLRANLTDRAKEPQGPMLIQSPTASLSVSPAAEWRDSQQALGRPSLCTSRWCTRLGWKKGTRSYSRAWCSPGLACSSLMLETGCYMSVFKRPPSTEALPTSSDAPERKEWWDPGKASTRNSVVLFDLHLKYIWKAADALAPNRLLTQMLALKNCLAPLYYPFINLSQEFDTSCHWKLGGGNLPFLTLGKRQNITINPNSHHLYPAHRSLVQKCWCVCVCVCVCVCRILSALTTPYNDISTRKQGCWENEPIFTEHGVLWLVSPIIFYFLYTECEKH
jgi:hypothetical protein